MVLIRKRGRKDVRGGAETLALAQDLKSDGVIETVHLRSPRANKTVDQMAREAIDQYMQTHGARKFAPATSADDFNLCVFLRWAGYRVQRNCSFEMRRAPFFINERPYSRKSFLAFVDKVRKAFDLQPIGKPA